MNEEEQARERANGWFEKYVLDSFSRLNTSVSKIHSRIDKIHEPPCPDMVTVKGEVGQLKTGMSMMKWILGAVGLSFLTVIGLLITLIRMVAATP